MPGKNLVHILAPVVFLLSATTGFAQNATIVSPGTKTVSSPVRVVADFSSTAPITSITVSVDGVATSPAEPVTPLDLNIPMSAGSHVLTVNALQSDGLQLSASRNVTVSSPTTASTATTMASTTNTASSTSTVPASHITINSSGGTSWVSDIEEQPGWYTYPDQGHPDCSSKPYLTGSPSLDGTSGKFYLGPHGQYNNCLWPILLGNSSATHFTLDTYYRLSDPQKSNGIEFSSNKHIGTKWYKFSVQCSYNKGIFSVWDTAGAKWSPTSIPCKRPSLNSWDHLTVNTQISNGKAVFLSIKLNGVTHYVNKSFYPTTKSTSSSFGVHFQMNGNQAGNAYYAWVDNFKFTLW